jgi:hypothetical protein
MKLKNLTDLAKKLKSLKNTPSSKLGFDMGVPYVTRDFSNHPCGSACCIGGWVQHLNPETREMSLEEAVMSISPDGVSYKEAERLCYPDSEVSAWKATPQQAARAVEILRDTGKCDWDRAMTEVAA